MRAWSLAITAACSSSTTVPREQMPLPGETATRASDLDEPDFRLDPEEHPGQLMEDEIDAVFQHANADLARCYNARLVDDPHVKGTARTVLVIETDGSVAAVSSSGIDHVLGRCIDQTVSRLVFPPPRGGTVKVRYPFTFSALATGDDGPSGQVTSGRRR